MLRKLLCIVLLMAAGAASAQDCYRYTRAQAIERYNKGEYEIAKEQFVTARTCPDKPQTDDLDAWIGRCTAKIAERGLDARGYMRIRGVEFANEDNDDVRINEYGAPLTAPAVKFLMTRIRYDGLAGSEKTIELKWKIIGPDGNLKSGSNSPEGYTFSNTVTVKPGTNRYIYLDGWGTNAGGSYEAGNYRLEIWYKGRKLHTQPFTLLEGAGATYLTVDSKTAVSSTYSATAGSETYYVSTDAPSYEVWLLPSWCSVSEQTSTSFTIRWTDNDTDASRSDWFQVKAGEQTVRVDVTQAAPNTALARRKYEALMRKAMENSTFSYSNGGYKGEVSNGQRAGLGVYWWNDDTYHWGRWSGGDMNGVGIRLIPKGYYLTNCPDCVFFVGKYDSDKMSGKGTCYNENGDLIYYGEFANDHPSGTYPAPEGYASYKFVCLEYTDGDMYVGETKDGKRDGFGIYLWASGGAWYGPWTEGKRDGYGIYIPHRGSVSTGKWKDDTKID